jgi:hypothetical protein
MSDSRPFRFPKVLGRWNAFHWSTAAAKLPLIAVFIFPLLGPAVARSQTEKFDAQHPPRFEDYPATEVWNGTPASLKRTTRSELMFKTKLTNAAKEPPNFAGHNRIAIWGCGSECISGAIIDLQDGVVHSPPLATNATNEMHFSVCQTAYENSGVDYRLNSRLLILRCGLNYSERLQTNVPDTHYFVMESGLFRELLFVSGKNPPKGMLDTTKVPYISGRLATEADTKSGKAVFYLGNPKESKAHPYAIVLPKRGRVRDEETGILQDVIVTQAEQGLGNGQMMIVVGYRKIDGGVGLCQLEEVHWLDALLPLH